MTHYFLIPVYNERPNIEFLFNAFVRVLDNKKFFFVFVDDGSSDGTSETIDFYFKSMDYKILGDGKNYGPGASFNTGFEWILQHSQSNKDRVITLEGDNTSDLGILDTMLILSNQNYELVLASVYAQGGGFDKTSFIRRFLSSFANLFFRFVFGIKVQTLSSFYRVYAIDLLRNIKLAHPKIIEERGFLCMIEILLKSINCRASIIEVPMILNTSKRKGKSKMKLVKTSFNYLKFFISHFLLKNRS